MTEEGRLPIDDSISPLPTEHFAEGLVCLREKTGLTWWQLAARATVTERDATLRWGEGWGRVPAPGPW